MPLAEHDHAPPNWLKVRISRWFWSLTPTCREVVRLTSEARDHPLPLGVRVRLGLHRRFCRWCARYATQLNFLGEASQLFPEHLEEVSGPSLDTDAKERLKRALRDPQHRHAA